MSDKCSLEEEIMRTDINSIINILFRFSPLFLIGLLLACSEVDQMTLFKKFAYSDSENKVQALKGGRVNCMGCPNFFKYKSEPSINNAIILRHKLQEVSEYPDDLVTLNEAINYDVDWWGLQERDLDENSFSITRFMYVKRARIEVRAGPLELHSPRRNTGRLISIFHSPFFPSRPL